MSIHPLSLAILSKLFELRFTFSYETSYSEVSHFDKQGYPKKTAEILRRHQWFPREMTSEKRVQQFHIYDTSLPSLRASSPIWASEASLARTCEQAAKPRGQRGGGGEGGQRKGGGGQRGRGAAPRSRVLARLASLSQIGELARRLVTTQIWLVLLIG